MYPSLSELVDDLNNEQDFLTRVQAVSDLSQYPETETVEWLLIALRDPYFQVRKKAALALKSIHDPRVVEPLVAAVTDIPSVRDAALDTLESRTIPLEVQARISSYQDTYALYKRRRELREEGPFTNEASMHSLLQAATDPDFLLREAAVTALGSMHDEDAFLALTTACEDLYLCVREAAMHSLSGYKGPLSITVLTDVMTTPNWMLFDVLVDLLLRRKYEHIVDVLVHLLHHHTFTIRRRARTGLTRIPGVASLTPLIESLNEWDSADNTIPAYTIARFYQEKRFDHVTYFSQAMMGLSGSVVERDWPAGIKALHWMADHNEWRHLAFFSTAEIDRKNQFDVASVLDRTYTIQRKYAAEYLCTHHMARFQVFNHRGNKYLGCRICKQTHTSLKAPTVALVLDAELPLITHGRNELYRINWLKSRAWVDFDRVEIGSCSVDAITDFCIAIGNDTDTFRAKRYKTASCYIESGIVLPAETINLLKNRFNQVVTL